MALTSIKIKRRIKIMQCMNKWLLENTLTINIFFILHTFYCVIYTIFCIICTLFCKLYIFFCKFTLFSIFFSVKFAFFKTDVISVGFCFLVKARPYIELVICYKKYMQTLQNIRLLFKPFCIQPIFVLFPLRYYVFQAQT